MSKRAKLTKNSRPRRDASPREERLHEIWRIVRRIPRGSVVTYGDIAEALRPPCNPRLVGWAMGKAPAGLELPWHRVLAAGGRIALPGPTGLEQRFRLQTEGVTFSGSKVRLKLHRWQPGNRKRKSE